MFYKTNVFHSALTRQENKTKLRYVNLSAALGFLQLTLVVGQDLAHKLSWESPRITYVLQSHSFTLPLDYHLWNWPVVEVPATQIKPFSFSFVLPGSSSTASHKLLQLCLAWISRHQASAWTPQEKCCCLAIFFCSLLDKNLGGIRWS